MVLQLLLQWLHLLGLVIHTDTHTRTLVIHTDTHTCMSYYYNGCISCG